MNKQKQTILKTQLSNVEVFINSIINNLLDPLPTLCCKGYFVHKISYFVHKKHFYDNIKKY